MYGLPQDIDLTFFVGQMLSQVCFSRHILILNFDDNVSISIESSIGFSSPNSDIQKNEDFCLMADTLLSLLEQKIISVHTDPNGTLTLCFANIALIIYDDSSCYESYVIQNGMTVIVV